VGVDNIDVPAATRQGIVVMNTPGGNTVSTAEHTMALLLALSRNVAPANDSLKAGRWDRGKFTGTQLEGKALGIIGLGRVGLAVAQRARGFDMKVVGFDPFLSAERALELGIESVSRLDDLWGRCDFITLHTPLTPETRNLIGPRQLEQMKPGVRLINCARGGLIDEEALAEALGLRSGRRRRHRRLRPGAPAGRHPLVAHPQVLVTPHLGGLDRGGAGGRRRRGRAAPDRLPGPRPGPLRRQHGDPEPGRAGGAATLPRPGPPPGDAPRPDGPGHRPLGHPALSGGGGLKNTRLITASFAAGWLEAALEEQVNLVNAEALLKERGIALIEETSHDTGDFGTVVQTEVETERKTYVAAGTLFGKQFIRLVRLGPTTWTPTSTGPCWSSRTRISRA
jgi:D-3-phosphoglycerate dehydrogenase